MSNITDNTGGPSARSHTSQLPDPYKIREQAREKARSITPPDLGSMTNEEIQQLFYEMQVKQIEGDLQVEQLLSQLGKMDDQAALFSIVTENMLDMVALTDMEGNFTFAGKSHEILGYEPGHLIGKNVMDFVHPEDLPRVLEKFGEFVSSGHPRKVEYRNRCKDGTYLWLETAGNFIKDENGIPQKIVFSSRNITERKQAEEALRVSEKKHRRLFETMTQGVVYRDVNGKIISANPAAERILGLSFSQMLGKTSVNPCWKMIREDGTEVPGTDHPSMIALRTGETVGPVTRGVSHPNKNTYVWLSITVTPLFQSGGTRPFQVYATFEDITERKQAIEELKEREAFIKATLDNLPVGVAINSVDPEVKFTYMNENFARFYRTTREELAASNDFWEVVYTDATFREQIKKRVLEDCASNDPERMYWEDVPISRPGKKPFYITAKNIPLPENNLMVSTVWDVTNRKQAEDALRQRESLLQRIFDILPIGLWFADENGRLLRGNPAGVEIWGAEPLVDPSEYGVFTARRYPSGEAVTPDTWALARTIRSGATILDELLEIDAFDGKKKIILNSTAPVLDEKGDIEGAVVINQDVTEREKLQCQLNQAQKMESVGRLAGGVAHDFNNMLSIINGYAEITIDMLDPGHPVRQNIREIYNAGTRSADIIKQLLAFARRQTISPRQLDLNDTISGMLKMLQRLIGENIELTWHPGNNLWPVKIDPSQVDQIMANLAVNARDAISNVGKLTIETKNVVCDEEYCKAYAYFIPGQYVMLAVSDDGCGMETEIQSNLFEPFFTTKETGKGTGLGLSTIYGIVKQNDGFINVYSEPGIGTTFKIYLPRHDKDEVSDISTKTSTEYMPTGSETILLVEDETPILRMARATLEKLGYTVLTAASPKYALELARDHDGEVHLLITDLVMPEMNGRDLALHLAGDNPELKTLYMSGYTADVIARHGIIDEGVKFIQKPFSLKDLAAKVRDAIDSYNN